MTTTTRYSTTNVRWPSWLAIIGGLIILIEGILIAAAGTLETMNFIDLGLGDLGLGAVIFGVVVIIHGVIIMWAGYRLDANRMIYGGVILIFAVLALVLAGGGFVIGSLLAIVGALWAMFVR